MDPTDALEALSNLLTELTSHPYDISLHAEHIRLAEASGIEEQVHAARKMLLAFWPAIDEVWFPLIDEEVGKGVDDFEAVQRVHTLFEKAEQDYLSVKLLLKHVQFLVQRHEFFTSSEVHVPSGMDTSWMREAIASVVEKGAGHPTEGQVLWDARCEWENKQLESATGPTRDKLIALVEEFYLNRLKQPHSTHESTFQSYSTFTTTYKSQNVYEQVMVSASKAKSAAVKAWTRREPLESALAASGNSAEGFAYYLAAERKTRQPDLYFLTVLNERAIADTAKRRFQGDVNAELALRSFWIGYSDVLRRNTAAEEQQLQVLKRAVRDVPGSGEMWSRYIRFLEQHEPALSREESVADAYNRALGTGLLERDAHQLIPLALARAGYEKRKIEAGIADGGGFDALIKVLEDAIGMLRHAKQWDPQYRLEKYLADLYLNLADVPENAISVWQATAKHRKTSYLAWISYTDVLIKQGQYNEARSIFKEVSSKNIDWPEAAFEAWLQFEHLYGSLEDVQACLDKIERAQMQVDTRRAKEAEKAAYQQMQTATEAQASVPVQNTPVSAAVDDMAVDSADQSQGLDSRKRKMDEIEGVNGSKRAKLDNAQVPLKRDRENCTVFVADLDQEVSKEDLEVIFKDCGDIKEIKISSFQDGMVATVEFGDRDSVLAALTKDKKRAKGREISVHIAWQSTLYVTNFPTAMDDAEMRALFTQYGTIFDVRWPSKKFKNSRRFCYLQFLSPDAAKAALEMHGRELEAGLPLQVYISDPERKKGRTDANANAKEVYVAGLSKFTTKVDLEKVFSAYGTIKDIRLGLDDAGHCKGSAFVEYDDEVCAERALQANNHEIKNRRIAVTSADSRVRTRPRTGKTEKEELRARSVRVKNLPPGTQEGLLQQTLEKIATVKRVEVLQELQEASVELETAADVGKLLLLTEPMEFGGAKLTFSEEPLNPVSASRPIAPLAKTGGMFVPRAALSRPRAGLGSRRKPQAPATQDVPETDAADPKQVKGKGQDDFRKMLG